MRHAVATQIKRIRSLVRAGDCRAAQQRFDALIPLIGSRGQASGAKLKGPTVARLWGMVNACRWKGRR